MHIFTQLARGYSSTQHEEHNGNKKIEKRRNTHRTRASLLDSNSGEGLNPIMLQFFLFPFCFHLFFSPSFFWTGSWLLVIEFFCVHVDVDEAQNELELQFEALMVY
ncbi:unnamed protein product [Vicia faba]|uniref:Uncharacterized protein n=1 Tax=Vicia faba TaxID=3906 RepID=A0AAV1AJ70_VICFA|nr:unnamed protein product [Vicia faba]